MTTVFSPLLWTQLRALRHTLHSTAELSNQEAHTAATVSHFVTAYSPDARFAELGGYGFAAVFEGSEPGPTVLVRAELDALPRDHADDLTMHRSGAEHRCGHDGHMSVVAGLAPVLSFERPRRGRVVLLFQPAEEIGEGAARMLDDPRFSQIRPDYAVAMHNMPGYPWASIVLRGGTFASASVGIEVGLEGWASHAAEPEKALCPSDVLAKLLIGLPTMATGEADGPLRMVTITHAQMGELTFGVTPGYARLRATLRAHSTEGLDSLCADVEQRVLDLSHAAGLRVDITWHDRFPATVNDATLVSLLRDVQREAELGLTDLERPMRWSDDFGHFSNICPSLYFGLGIGEDAKSLHHPEYAFPDDAIAVGVRLLHSLVQRLLNREPLRTPLEAFG